MSSQHEGVGSDFQAKVDESRESGGERVIGEENLLDRTAFLWFAWVDRFGVSFSVHQFLGYGSAHVG